MFKEIRSLLDMLEGLDEEAESVASAELPAAVEIPHSVAISAPAGGGSPAAFILDPDEASARALAAAVIRLGLDPRVFAQNADFATGVAEDRPAMVFLDVAGQGDAAIDALFALGERRFAGPVQLMGAESMAVVEVVNRMGARHALRMLPALPKPIDGRRLRDIMRSQGLDHAPVPMNTGSLDEALANDWIEFWYQPKIDLGKKQLRGVETFARVRHPELGTLPPGAFMQGATETDLVRLAERALVSALVAASNFSRLGINLRIAVNVPVRALFELPVTDMVREHGPRHVRWPGLLLDVTEEQVVANLDRIQAIGQGLVACNVTLAIDDFGRGRLPPSKLRELPFTELKLDRAFVSGCADDLARSTICRSVIELAHHFDCTAVAVGIERGADMRALANMGCDLGQGFLFGQPVPEEELVEILIKRAVAPGRDAHRQAGSGPRRARWH
jgi:EAL domain-containing protein (putative c-di-GMP-specific phosphodiesterase class I)